MFNLNKKITVYLFGQLYYRNKLNIIRYNGDVEKTNISS